MAAGVVVSNTLPASVNYGSAFSTVGSCSRIGQLVTCNIGTLNNGNTATITIIATNTAAGVITNLANLYSPTPDSNSANNSVSIVNTVSLPSLSINKTGTNVVLLWPSAATAFQLQSLPILGQSNWTQVTNAPIITNNQFMLTRPIGATNQHYRLRMP
jgi:hypothetical protein